MGKRRKGHRAADAELSPQARLLLLVEETINVTKTARRHKQSLNGTNHYADKLANLRADATNEFRRLPAPSVGDTSALAELLERVLSTSISAKDRAQAARDFKFAIKTRFAATEKDTSKDEEAGVFPLVKLSQTNRGYLVSVGRQMNGCYASRWFDGCAVMMRRLLESVIIEAFEAKGIDSKIKSPKSGDFFQLTDLINAAIAEASWNLPRNVKKELPNLRDLGHRSAHNRYYLATRDDIDKLAAPYRETAEAFLHLAGLL